MNEVAPLHCLNPYCSGQWSHTNGSNAAELADLLVLILIVVDNGLVQSHQAMLDAIKLGLNPYCSGQWSRTRPYKTILIISKLKNFTKQILTFLNRKLTIP